jgi:hypothetical protein
MRAIALSFCSGCIVAKPSPTLFLPARDPLNAQNRIGDGVPVIQPEPSKVTFSVVPVSGSEQRSGYRRQLRLIGREVKNKMCPRTEFGDGFACHGNMPFFVPG